MLMRESVEPIPVDGAPGVPQVSRRNPRVLVVSMGSLLGALAASSCCVIPFALFTLGVGGAWIGSLTKLAPYQPAFLALALGFLAAGFVLVYRRPRAACADGAYCARPASHRVAKAALWMAAALVAAALAFPYAVRPFLDG